MSQKFKSEIELQSLNNATTDTDRFLVSDSGVVKYRTGAEVLSDLGITLNTASVLKHQVKAGVAINKGQAVYVTSADGTNMIVGLASNASEATSSKTMGLLDATVAINGLANVITEGLLAGLNTVGANAGDPVWLGTGGNLIYGLTNKPYAPAHMVFIGIVTRVNANNGEIFVKVQNGFELDELHNVDINTTTPISGHILGFNGTLWVNKTIAGWLGYTPANANGTTNYVSKFTSATTLGNSQIFDNGTNVGIGTTSPSEKLHISGNTLVTGTLEVDTVNNGIGDFLTRTAGGIVTRRTAAEVRSDIGAQAALTNPVTGTGTLNFVSKFTSTGSTLGNSQIFDNGTSVAVGTSTPHPAGVKFLIYEASTPTIVGYFQNNNSICYTGYHSSTTTLNSVRVGAQGNNLLFSVSPDGSPNERMRITSDGNVGIGNTSPTNKLIVDSNTNRADGIVSRNLSTGGSAYTFVGAFNNTNNGIDLRSYPNTNAVYPSTSFLASSSGQTGGLIISQAGTNPIMFLVNGGERMRITSSGNVGIGTTSPNQKLNVVGDVLFSSSGSSAYFGNHYFSLYTFYNSYEASIFSNLGIADTNYNVKIQVYDQSNSYPVSLEVQSDGTDSIGATNRQQLNAVGLIQSETTPSDTSAPYKWIKIFNKDDNTHYFIPVYL